MGGVSGRRRGRDEKHERAEAWGGVKGGGMGGMRSMRGLRHGDV